MIIEFPDGEKISILFQHNHPAKPIEFGTKCFIRSITNGQLLSKGATRLSKEDKFVKSEGRDYSLSRALRKFPNEDRERIIREYNKYVKTPFKDKK